MEDCRIGKELNPASCRYVNECKKGQIRNDKFRCVKEPVAKESKLKKPAKIVEELFRESSKPKKSKVTYKTKTPKVVESDEPEYDPDENKPKKSKVTYKSKVTKKTVKSESNESYNENVNNTGLVNSNNSNNYKPRPKVAFTTPKKSKSAISKATNRFLSMLKKKSTTNVSKKEKLPTKSKTAKATVEKPKATVTAKATKTAKAKVEKSKATKTAKATVTAKVEKPKATKTAKVKAKTNTNGIIRVKRTGQTYHGVKYTKPDGLGQFLLAGDLSILKKYRTKNHIQPSVDGSSYDKDVEKYWDSLTLATKNMFEKASRLAADNYDLLENSNKAGWMAFLSHLNLYRYNPYKLGLLGLEPLTKVVNNEPTEKMGIEDSMPIISSCLVPLPGEKDYGKRPNIPLNDPNEISVKSSSSSSSDSSKSASFKTRPISKDALKDLAKTTQKMFDNTTFVFYSKSGNVRPGKGKGEHIDDSKITNFNNLKEISNWRQKLSNFYIDPFELDGKQWNSVEHFYQGSKFKKQNPDFYEEFSLDSGSDISKDPALAKNAGGKTGKHNSKRVRPTKVVIDDDFFSSGRNIMAMFKAQYAKFIQNPELTKLLYLTKPAKLVHYRRAKESEPFYGLMYIRSLITQ